MVFYVKQHFEWDVTYIISTQKKISATLYLLALFERLLENNSRENLTTHCLKLDWANASLCRF
jgi:hypothetical protein